MSEYVELEVTVNRTTDKAVLIEIDGEEIWVPFSQVEDNGEEFQRGYEGQIYVTQWFCEKEGLA